MIYTYTPKRLIAGSALTASIATYYSPNSAYGAIIKELMFVNTDTVARVVTAHVIPAGGSASVATRIFSETLQPGQRWVDSCCSVIPAGAFLQALADAADVVAINASGLEIS